MVADFHIGDRRRCGNRRPPYSAFALDEGRATSHKLGLVATSPKHDAKTIQQAIDRVASSIARHHASTPRLLLLGIANGGLVLAARLTGA